MSGGFDLMRFQKCSDTLIPSIRKNAKWITFWVFAWFVLFSCLDSQSAIRSEARWFEVVREMLMTGDWLHPRINGQPYFDKPLVSYWFAALLSKLGGGRVTAMTIRMPSVLFALAGLACIVSVARKFYSERTAYLAGWLLLSTYSFIYWGRLGEADMEQTVFIVLAVTVYLHHRETASFWAYFAFWACCAVGAQTKGLPAFVIPPALAVIDCMIRKSFRQHLNWKFFLAFFLGGLCLYAVPFVLEAMTSKNYGASGIVLVFRENLMRVFNPWDHNKDPFYVYFFYLPRLLIPWTPFFIFAVIDYIRDLIRAVAKQGTASVEDLSARKPGSRDTLWLFASIVFIFVLFSASRSRRSYYILPAVPWCILFTAVWFSAPAESWTFLRKLTDKFAKLVDVLIPVAAGLLIFLTASLMAYSAFSPAGIGRLFSPLLYWDDLKHVMFFLLPFGFIAGIVWLVIWRRSRRKLLREGGEGAFAPSADPLNRAVPFVAFVMFTVFPVVIPTFGGTDSFDPDRVFCRFIRFDLERLTKLDPGFLKRTAYFGSAGNAELTFFLNLPEPIRAFSLEKLDDTNRTFTSDTVVIEGPDEFRVFLADVLEHGGMVITRGDWVDALEESEECRDILEMLRGEEMVFRTSDLPRIKEYTLEKLKEKPGWQDDPKALRKIKKMNEKRICIFYHIPESIAEEVPMIPESWFGSSADRSLIDGTEGTTQL
ncbi:MAG: glycosyltransferase family 39 protein [Lentisphaeria bacterium]|nr:glycosyltransferase family 39 protein [Lentisphaeria bacterium]